MSAGKNRSSVEETPWDVNRRLASPSAELLPRNNCFIPNMRSRGFRAAVLGVDPSGEESPLEPQLLYQGEIVLGVPIAWMPRPKNWLLIRTKSGRRVDEALNQGDIGGLVRVLDSNLSQIEWNEHGDGDFVMARLEKQPVLLLSQTSDVATKKFIQVAPIFTVSDGSYLEKLVRDDIKSAFWLAKHPCQRIVTLISNSYRPFTVATSSARMTFNIFV
jgi:hypothetical protein